MRQKLSKSYGYSFGPDRPSTFVISNISNEGKGEIEIILGYDDSVDENGKKIKVPVKHLVRYAVTPGLKATKQTEKEIVVVDVLPESEYKVALGIFYPGQREVTMTWDERTYTRVDYMLDYHNACKAQIKYLTCGTSKCIKYSENKTVNTK